MGLGAYNRSNDDAMMVNVDEMKIHSTFLLGIYMMDGKAKVKNDQMDGEDEFDCNWSGVRDFRLWNGGWKRCGENGHDLRDDKYGLMVFWK